MNAIERLQSQKIPTNSFIQAIHTLSENGVQMPEVYRSNYAELSGHDMPACLDDHARFHYLYLVQETVRQNMQTGNVNMAEVIDLAEERAKSYIAKNPWIFAKPEVGSPNYREPKMDAAGNPKQKKGAKREKAISLWNKHKDENLTRKQWIELLVAEVGMTPAGASTYHADLKAGRMK